MLADTNGVFSLPEAEGGSVALVGSPQRQEREGGKSKTGLTVDPFDIQVDILLSLPLWLLFAPPKKKEASSSQR